MVPYSLSTRVLHYTFSSLLARNLQCGYGIFNPWTVRQVPLQPASCITLQFFSHICSAFGSFTLSSVDVIALRGYVWMQTSNVTQPAKKRSTPIHGRAAFRAGTARGSLTQSLGKSHLQTYHILFNASS